MGGGRSEGPSALDARAIRSAVLRCTPRAGFSRAWPLRTTRTFDWDSRADASR